MSARPGRESRDGLRLHHHRRRNGRLRARRPAERGPGRAGAAAGGGQRRAAAGHGRPGRVARTWSARRRTGPASPPPRRTPGRCPTPAAGGWAGPGRSTRWPTCAATRAVYDAWAGRRRGRVGIRQPAAVLQAVGEHAEGRDPALRGTGGPVRVAPVPETSRHPAARALAEALCALGFPVTGDLSGSQQEGVAWPDLAIAGGRRVSPDSAYLRPALRPPEPHRPRPLPGHPPAHQRRPVHRRRLPPRRRPAAGARVGGGDRVRGRDRLAAAADAVRHRPGRRTCAGSASTRSPTCPGSERNLQDHPVAMACYAAPRRCPPAGTTTGRCYAVAAQPAGAAPGPTCSCSRSCCPSRRPAYPAPGRRLRPGGQRDRPRQPRHGPAGLRRPGGGRR